MSRVHRWGQVATVLAACTACEARGPTPTAAPPAGSIVFGVFGDGPYDSNEAGPYRGVLGDVNATRPEWLIHVGDITGGPCDDAVIRSRQQELDALETAVVYTPGDNEWVDCHRKSRGGYQPLERLAFLRSTFFSHPGRTLGTRPFDVETQSADSRWTPFVEHVRWQRGRVLFAMLHLVGSANAAANFAQRTAQDDSAASQRTRAALDWMEAAFTRARRDSLTAVVLTIHADPGLDRKNGARQGYDTFTLALRSHLAAFDGQVVLIHGDTHVYRVDHPLLDEAGAPIERFTRIETFGSPVIGWVRVAIDTTSGRLTMVEPRPMTR